MFFFPASLRPASSFSSCHHLLLRALPSFLSCPLPPSPLPLCCFVHRFFLLPSSFSSWPLCSCAANLSVGKAPPVSAAMEEAETKGDGEALTSFPVAGTEPVPRGQDQSQSRKSLPQSQRPRLASGTRDMQTHASANYPGQALRAAISIYQNKISVG